jgi:peptidoglycan/xylan/chitin deacetylase (PgdA/CDA1 family)
LSLYYYWIVGEVLVSSRRLVCALWAISALALPLLAQEQAGDDVQYPIVLGMHQVTGNYDDTDPFGPVLKLSDFERLLGWLKDNGIRTLSMAEYCEAIRLPDPPRDAVLLTVDDGYETVYTELYPRLRERGMRMTSFVITDRVGETNTVNPHQPWLTWEQCREMAASGIVDIEAHAARSHQEIKGRRSGQIVTEPWMVTRLFDPTTRLEESEESYRSRVREELRTAAQAIETHTGRRPLGFCWPFGVTNEFAVQACRDAGYLASFTLNKRMADPGCRMRFHIPEQEDQALALLTPRPERSAELYPPPVEPKIEPIPVRPSPQAATREPARPLLPMALAGGGALIVWGLFYVLLFRHDPE